MTSRVQNNMDEMDESESSSSSDYDMPDAVGTGTIGTQGQRRGSSKQQDEAVIASRETKVVLRFKFVVAAVLISTALGVALGVFYYVAGSENSQFEKKFRDDSVKIMDSIGGNIDRTLGIFDGLAVTLVSSARASGDEWPFFTMPDFGVRMSKLLAPSHSLAISILPIVAPNQREEWENYTTANNAWINETIAVQESWTDYHGPIVYDWLPTPVIYGDNGDIPRNESRTFLPIWQAFPVIPYQASSLYNWDWLSTTEQHSASIRNCMANHQAVVGAPYMLPTPDDAEAQAETDGWIEWFRVFLQPGEEPYEPVSNMVYPVVADLNRIELMAKDNQTYQPHEHKIVAILVAEFYWREKFKNILPLESDGIDVVVTNPCTQSFTYRIRGHTTVYRGVGDRHETKYDDLVYTKTLAELSLNSSQAAEYSGVPLNTEYCQFTLFVYPSGEMESAHTTHNRIVFTVCAVLIFAFTSLVFWLYDVMVERRQTMVMRTAVRSSAIVTSLFPVDVRDRLYGNATPEQQATMKTSLLSGGKPSNEMDSGAVSAEEMFASSPIAELYPDTTVLFADIAGFTAWSAQRLPTQVFRLLETIYYSFDVIAKRRGVFKVETIGDSYVAVVGLPTPNRQHAVVMARFARDIRFKMQDVVRDLAKTLGEDTADLVLRIGLNSGPTTAGVLRGEKSRFQLFGDTVNTAARMESNGEPSKIHVSKSTADLLVASGKGHWLTIRDTQIMAKGKGLMQTYFCEPKVGGGGTSREFSAGASNSNSGGGSATESVIGEDELLVMDPSLDDKANTINANAAVASVTDNDDEACGNVCHESFTANSEEVA